MFSYQKPSFQFFILFFLAFIWGSSFILIKKSLLLFTDLEVAALRIFLSALVLVPFGITRIFKLSKADLLNVTISGLIGTGIPAFLFTIAQKHLTSSEASIYNSITPLFTLLFAYYIFKTRIHYYNIIGVLIGLLGTVFLILQKASSHQGFISIPEYGILLIIATIMYGYNTNFIKHKLKDVDGMTIVSVSFLVMLLPSLFFLTNNSFVQKFNHQLFPSSLLYILILSVLGTSIALVIWNKLIKNISAIYASTVTYIIPIFALIWGYLDNEKFNLNHIVAILCIFTGIYLVNYKSKNGV